VATLQSTQSPKELLGRAPEPVLRKTGRDRMATPLGILGSYHYVFHAHVGFTWLFHCSSGYWYVKFSLFPFVYLFPYLLSVFHVPPLSFFLILFISMFRPFPFSLCLLVCMIPYPLSLFARFSIILYVYLLLVMHVFFYLSNAFIKLPMCYCFSPKC